MYDRVRVNFMHLSLFGMTNKVLKGDMDILWEGYTVRWLNESEEWVNTMRCTIIKRVMNKVKRYYGHAYCESQLQ